MMVFDIIAQQDPQYSHYMFNQMAVNPGHAGSQDAICLSLIHRQQWQGIEGAPVTPVFTVNAPFKLFGKDHGFGLTVMSDQFGFNQDVSAGLSYAYRLPLGSGKLGIGVSGMFLNNVLKANWKIPTGGTAWEQDPSIPGPNESIVGFDMGFGVFYRAENVYLGLSSTHLLEPNMNYEKDDAKYTLKRHFYATAGCVLPLSNPIWELAPSIGAYSDGTASQFTANMNMMYNKKLWGGVGYRLNDAIIVMVGVDLFSGMKIGYAFDYTYTSLSNHFTAGGSHEVMVSYCFNLIKEKVVKKYKSVRFL
jgi:type IX secretion system PorP/SprF family membrane protein